MGHARETEKCALWVFGKAGSNSDQTGAPPTPAAPAAHAAGLHIVNEEMEELEDCAAGFNRRIAITESNVDEVRPQLVAASCSCDVASQEFPSQKSRQRWPVPAPPRRRPETHRR
jgi:hypothetical protein